MARPRRLAALLAVALAASVSASLGQAAPRAGHTLLNYGDSVALGTGLFLDGYLRGWSVTESVDVSRHANEAPSDLRAFGAALPRVVVISLGANDSPSARDWFERQVRDVVRIAGPGRCVIWSTVLRPPYRGVSYDGLNASLRRLGRAHRTLHVFDWVALARAHPAWFGKDGVHPSMTGYRARAAAIARLAKSC
jgi:hypothetical protein